MEIRQSETKVMKRSQINLNVLNPKRHTDEAIKTQARNLKKVGFLGGVVINELTGNVVDGHRRIMALDNVHKYDGTEETDYDIKVEVCQLSDKQEKEQMTYMAVGNTEADMDLISLYIKDIDTKDIGLSDAEINALMKFVEANDEMEQNVENFENEKKEDFFDFLPTPTAVNPKTADLTPEEKKAIVKAGKERTREDAERYTESANAQIILAFDSMENKVAFCEMMGIDTEESVVRGEDILEQIK